MVVQVLKSSAFLSLATVISPAAHVRPGTPILRLRVTYESGDETSFEIKQGTLEALPLPMGQSARLRLQPIASSGCCMGGPGRGGSVRVVGGALGRCDRCPWTSAAIARGCWQAPVSYIRNGCGHSEGVNQQWN